MPCTPPPGGVEEEQTKSPFAGVAYGLGFKTGRVKSCLRFDTPPFMSPPTRLAFCRSRSDGPIEVFARMRPPKPGAKRSRSEEHTSELQSRQYLVCRLLLEKKKKTLLRSYIFTSIL